MLESKFVKFCNQPVAKNHQSIQCDTCDTFSVPIPRHKSRLSHVNVFLRRYGGQLKTAIKQEASEKMTGKDNKKEKKK